MAMSERILIAGAGPAGAATALAMLRAGLPASDIAVLDAMDGVIPWDEWVDLIQSHYPDGKRGRRDTACSTGRN